MSNIENTHKKRGTVIKVKKLNWCRKDYSEDNWESTTFYISADQEMEIVDRYTLSGLKSKKTSLLDEEYETLYKVLSEMEYRNRTCSGVDGICWKMYFKGTECFVGYVFSDEVEGNVVEILDKYDVKE